MPVQRWVVKETDRHHLECGHLDFSAGSGARLQEGMVIAVEPMVNAGGPEVRMRDEWVAETADGSPSAHFEHTVAVTAKGPWILTRPKEMTGPSW